MQQLYKAFMSPQYMARKVASIRSLDDVKFFAEAGKKVVGHLLDFKKKQAGRSRSGGELANQQAPEWEARYESRGFEESIS